AEAIPPLDEAIGLYEKTESLDSINLIDPLRVEGMAELGLHQPAKAIPPLERAAAIMAKRCAGPEQAGSVRSTLARALVAAHGDRNRAASLAKQAQADLASLPWKKAELRQFE